MATLDLVPAARGELIDLPHREPTVSRAIATALLLILLAFGSAAGWAFLAKLDGAALGQGTITVMGNRKTVQHLEGGIVSDLAVREGDMVEAGQVLLRIQGTQSRAMLEEMAGQYWSALVRLTRLQVEQAGQRTLRFPDKLMDRSSDNPALARAAQVQTAMFAARWQQYDAELAVLQGQIAQARQEIAGLRVQHRTAVEKIDYTRQELAGVLDLYHKGLERVPRVMAVRRALADSEGQRDDALAQIERAEQGIAVLQRQIEGKERTRQAEIAAEIETTQATLSDATARIKAVQDAVARTEVRAPIAGRVVGLKAFTVGGIVKPGDPIMDIVPGTDELVVETRVTPNDIDVVRAGQPAQVRLTAFKMRRTPTVDGVVDRVSADRFTDQKTGEAYFIAMVRLDPESLRQAGPLDLHPGMAADVMIRTGERRAIDYIAAPLFDSLARALVED
ncbi:HlyD family type I secretion periplasmic adaptor subunit [Azospirillum thermophilum]|uniref:Membrane fusion protein (MFP) family protein n=1 Tax=Azospirillum thermophilum TaxID=2202148 RepID=A0A2S2CMF5_9PROT|nr:HlyD family type I secretion periplasmic adaptor subunit [Azospirillum thermophilum]AWK85698.1 HlyD family type I secretion periplasmic adaptor subunit [Azospirillum thermophilum]